MENRANETAKDAGIKLAHITEEVSKAKRLVEEVVDDKKKQAQRAIKRGYVAAEERLEDTTYYIKRNPWQSVGLAAGIGTVAGFLLGLSCVLCMRPAAGRQ